MTLVQSLRAHGAVVNLKPDGMMQIVPPPMGMVLDYGARRQLFADLHQERRTGLAIWCMLREGQGSGYPPYWPAPQLDRALAIDRVEPCDHVWELSKGPERNNVFPPIICEKCGSPGVGV